ncbi:agamous-like MADS-box protein AGL75 [Quercus lobata]|uniref:agamous-like MADS-box protein AGL75 n=1 Tax=Quercus lobata TaxID=97700 RepID=UPI001248653D|nr:agamous-like MADS-box protein AGL75 [Quercus lobata]
MEAEQEQHEPQNSDSMEAEQEQHELQNDDQRARETSYKKRNPTVMKKANELSQLCNIPVCVISYGPDGNVDTWPESRDDVVELLNKYKEHNDEKLFEMRLNSLKTKLCVMKNRIQLLENKKRKWCNNNNNNSTTGIPNNNNYYDQVGSSSGSSRAKVARAYKLMNNEYY